MDINQDLKKDLPLNLRDRLNGELGAGEVVRVSLPGSFGEGLVVTDRRIMILREGLSGFGKDSSVDVFSYPLSGVTGAEVASTDNGGMLSVNGSGLPEEIEKRAVFFPSYDSDKFGAAKEAIDSMLSSASATPQAAAQAPAPASEIPSATDIDGACSKCGAKLKEKALFCSSCGANVGFLCEVCGDRIPNGSAFCSGCGSTAVPDEGKCPGCGRMMPNTYYGFCPWCGHSLATKCFVCGARISKTWVHCANCGRKIGSDVIDPRALRSAYGRATEQVQNTSPIFGQSTAGLELEPAAASEGSASVAAQRNEHGKQLFEQDDIEGAIREFEAAVQLEPNNSAYHCNLAVAYDENDRDEEAATEYRRTLELDPNDTTALLYMGYMYSENDDPEEAARLWKRVIEAAPGSADAEEARENLRHQGEL